ncbi:MAG: flavin reductase family protein [Ardenticatenaceae bacterium]|nr:flavin reductase family protein [Ardenticatenaceae bacterium]HBY97952.1 flavin reductase [Chloroflexota bacterium]
MPISVQTFKDVMSHFATGVTIVTTRQGSIVHGMTVNAFCSVSLDPMLVLVSVAKTLRSHFLIEASGSFAVNILAMEQMGWAERFAGRIPDVEDRFAGLPYTDAITGSPVLSGAIAWVDCRLWATYNGGDHTLFVGEVVDGAIPNRADPLLYYQSHWSRLAAEGPLTANPWPGDEDD